MIIALIGVIGSGKTAVGEALAERLGWRFIDADTSHVRPQGADTRHAAMPSDRESAGTLDALHAVMSLALDRRERLIVACSALTARDRDRLTGDLRRVRIVYLETSPDVLAARLAARHDRDASAKQLPLDLARLEKPSEAALTLDGAHDVDTIVGQIRLAFGV
jgi:gluconokinase